MSYLQCPECRLTVPASAYYLRGDVCPRCLTPMDERPTFSRQPGTREGSWSPFVHGPASPDPGVARRTGA